MKRCPKCPKIYIDYCDLYQCEICNTDLEDLSQLDGYEIHGIMMGDMSRIELEKLNE